MPKDVFHQAVVGGIRFDGVLSADGPYVTASSVAEDRPAGGIMTPRPDVDWIDLQTGEDRIREVLSATQHSRLPAGEGSTDALLGVVQTREGWSACWPGSRWTSAPASAARPWSPTPPRHWTP